MAREPGEGLRGPDFIGQAGRAWDLSGLLHDEMTVEHTASLGGWLIEVSLVPPNFDYHVAGLIHLRDIPGSPPPVKGRPDATHEFAMYALAYDDHNQIDPSDAATQRNFAGQDMVEWLAFPTDTRALQVVRFAIQMCVDGELPPVRGYRHSWADYFQSQE